MCGAAGTSGSLAPGESTKYGKSVSSSKPARPSRPRPHRSPGAARHRTDPLAGSLPGGSRRSRPRHQPRRGPGPHGQGQPAAAGDPAGRRHRRRAGRADRRGRGPGRADRPGGRRSRPVAGAAAQPGAEPGDQGDRPHRPDPGDLRRPRPDPRGSAPGRAGGAQLPALSPCPVVDPPRAAAWRFRLHRRSR